MQARRAWNIQMTSPHLSTRTAEIGLIDIPQLAAELGYKTRQQPATRSTRRDTAALARAKVLGPQACGQILLRLEAEDRAGLERLLRYCARRLRRRAALLN
jgi:hypothetical protein